MWQGSQNLHSTQKESHTQNKQMTAVWYISDPEEIVQSSWSLFHRHGTAAYKLSQISLFPHVLSAKDLPRGQTQVLNVHWIGWIDCHTAECDEDRAPESISDTYRSHDYHGD